jgi:hypothetical protein
MDGAAIPSAQEILRFTEEVLQRPEFGRGGGAPGRRLGFLERLLSWLGSRGPLQIGPAGSIILKSLLIVLLVLLVVYLARLLLSRSARWTLAHGKGLQAGAAERPEEGGVEPGLEQAEQALKRGDLRSAVRVLYRALTEMLAGMGYLDLARWKTGLTYLRECPASSEHYPLLLQTVQAYNAIVYGHYSYETEKIARLLSQLRARGDEP